MHFFVVVVKTRTEVLLHTTKWIGCLIKEAISNSPHLCLISFYEMTRIGKSTEMENRLVVARDSARSARLIMDMGFFLE